MINHEFLDVFLFKFPLDSTKILAVLMNPDEYDHAQLVETISKELATQ